MGDRYRGTRAPGCEGLLPPAFPEEESEPIWKSVSGESCKIRGSAFLFPSARAARARVRSAVSRRVNVIAGSRTRSATGIRLAGISWRNIRADLAPGYGNARAHKAGKNCGTSDTS